MFYIRKVEYSISELNNINTFIRFSLNHYIGTYGCDFDLKYLTEYLWFHTREGKNYSNIADKVEEIVRRSGIKEGLCLVNALHITASVFINDAEVGLIKDFNEWLESLAPNESTSRYRHNRTGEDNA